MAQAVLAYTSLPRAPTSAPDLQPTIGTAETDRDLERGRQAAAAVRADGGTAMDAALAAIGAAFDDGASTRALKRRVRRWLQLGADRPAVCARFGTRREMLADCSIEAACCRVDRWYKVERKALQIASALGRGRPLSVEILKELRLVLRWARRNHLSVADLWPSFLKAAE